MTYTYLVRPERIVSISNRGKFLLGKLEAVLSPIVEQYSFFIGEYINVEIDKEQKESIKLIAEQNSSDNIYYPKAIVLKESYVSELFLTLKDSVVLEEVIHTWMAIEHGLYFKGLMTQSGKVGESIFAHYAFLNNRLNLYFPSLCLDAEIDCIWDKTLEDSYNKTLLQKWRGYTHSKHLKKPVTLSEMNELLESTIPNQKASHEAYMVLRNYMYTIESNNLQTVS